MTRSVRVSRPVLERLREEARRAAPQECCGLLGGRDGVVTHIFTARNALASATAYEIAPAVLFRIFRELRAAGLEHLGIYHSHPAGENAPSARDIELAYYPEAVWFIVSPLPGAATPVRAFHIRDGEATELPVVPS